jgi:hypothetical protein
VHPVDTFFHISEADIDAIAIKSVVFIRIEARLIRQSKKLYHAHTVPFPFINR